MSISLRKSVPAAWRRAGRSVYVAAGQRSAERRLRPNFILIGGQRCGTTSLFRALMQNPQVVRPTFHKGVNYFDVNYHRGPDWYLGHFPLGPVARRRVPSGVEPVVFEASGYYMFHPFAMARVARDLPEVKLVAMLRDPVERAYSAWKHETERGFEWEDFETALALEDERLLGERDRMGRDPTYQSFTHRHHSYRGRGEYSTLLRAVLELFPRRQLHVMYSELFFNDPSTTFAELSDFLGLSSFEPIQFDRYNARPRQPMSENARGFLTSHYGDKNADLGALVGREPPWHLD